MHVSQTESCPLVAYVCRVNISIRLNILIFADTEHLSLLLRRHGEELSAKRINFWCQNRVYHDALGYCARASAGFPFAMLSR